MPSPPQRITIFWLKTRAGWRETVVNQVNVDASDSIRLLMQQIGERGRRIHDRVIDVEPGEPAGGGEPSSEAELRPSPVRLIVGG